MDAFTPAPALVHTPMAARAVAAAQRVREPEGFLRGGETIVEAGGNLVVDFGEEIVGVFEFAGRAHGTVRVEVFYGEDLAEALVTQDPFPADNWYKLPRDEHTLTAGEHTVRHAGRRAGRFLNIVVHGPGVFVLRTAAATLEHAPVEERGRFACSDVLLNDAWAISRRTIRLCLQRFYEDGVKRDGMLWIGDYRVEFLCAYALFGETVLARRSLEMMAACAHPNGSLSAAALRADGHQHPRINYIVAAVTDPGGLDRWVLDNYCADYVGALWEYVLHTGDREIVRQVAPELRALLAYLEKVDLTAAKGGKTFITDNQVDQSDWWGSRAALAFQIAAAFRHGARLLALLGDEAEAARYQEQADERVKQAAMFGDPNAGTLRDEVERGSSVSWHSYMAAWQAEALSAEELRNVFRQLQGDVAVRRPMAGFMEYWVLAAWFEAGLVHDALNEMRSYWGQMLRNGATTTWELVDRRVPGMDQIVVGGRSHCHGWSAGPAHLLPAYVLGITPTAPGFAEVAIRPLLGDLKWAEGEVPTPLGVIRARWNAGPKLTGEVELPTGVTGLLYLPARAPVRLAGGRRHAIG